MGWWNGGCWMAQPRHRRYVILLLQALPCADFLQQAGWTLRHKHTLFPKRAVSKIILLPKVSKCFILSGESLTISCERNDLILSW